jgi:hypothetical protein
MATTHRRGIQRCSSVDSTGRGVSAETWRKVLLVSGIASSVLYALMIWGIRYEGYSRISQVPSELTAIGAPTRALWVQLGWIYTALVAAFGFGLWTSAGRDRALRIVGVLVLAYASLGFLWPFAAMHQREVLAAGGGAPSDTIHIVLGGVTVLLTFLMIGFAAPAFGKRFRLYSIASIVVLLAFGGLTFLEAPRLQANLPTPWIGLWERINISVFLLWFVVLAAKLWRTGAAQGRWSSRVTSPCAISCKREIGRVNHDVEAGRLRMKTRRAVAPLSCLALTLFMVAASAQVPAPAAPDDGLLGTWRAVSYETWDAKGTRQTPFGPSPVGYLVLDATGHAFVALGESLAASANRAEAPAFAAYVGTYTVDVTQSLLRIQVEGSNLPGYPGSLQERKYTLQGDTLILGIEGQYRATLARVAVPRRAR